MTIPFCRCWSVTIWHQSSRTQFRGSRSAESCGAASEPRWSALSSTTTSPLSRALSGATPDYTTAFNDLPTYPPTSPTPSSTATATSIWTRCSRTSAPPRRPPTPRSSVDLGGLLSPAGSLINGIGFTDSLGDCSIACATLDVPATAVGPIASLFLQDQAIAESIGWDGVGQPLAHLFTELTTLFN